MSKFGLSHTTNLREIIEDLKKDMGVPDENVILIVNVKREGVEKVVAALELAGIVEQIGALRPVNNRKD